MLGYRITADGDYGPETRKVAASFQTHDGLVADGGGTETELRRGLATF
jgi:peptidoglycan hydrolase-like protein with peptidoglycan-binding domain